MEAAPFMVGSFSNPGPRKRPGGTNRVADFNHMSVNPLKACNRFVFTRHSRIYLCLLHTGPEQEQPQPGQMCALVLCCTSAGLGSVFTISRVCVENPAER